MSEVFPIGAGLASCDEEVSDDVVVGTAFSSEEDEEDEESSDFLVGFCNV